MFVLVVFASSNLLAAYFIGIVVYVFYSLNFTHLIQLMCRINIEVLDLVANDGAKCRGKSLHITTLKDKTSITKKRSLI